MCLCCNCDSDTVAFFYFFFFKQKTAYEMRISDWSSDVCSSDLRLAGPELRRMAELRRDSADHARGDGRGRGPALSVAPRRRPDRHRSRAQGPRRPRQLGTGRIDHHPARAEEHTAELQSLTRSSYAVFCVKTKRRTHGANQKRTA